MSSSGDNILIAAKLVLVLVKYHDWYHRIYIRRGVLNFHPHTNSIIKVDEHINKTWIENFGRGEKKSTLDKKLRQFMRRGEKKSHHCKSPDTERSGFILTH